MASADFSQFVVTTHFFKYVYSKFVMNTRTSARYYDFDLNYNNQFNIEEK